MFSKLATRVTRVQPLSQMPAAAFATSKKPSTRLRSVWELGIWELGVGIGDWDAEEGAAADTIIDTVEAHAPGFRASIVGRQILSPKGLERKFGLVGGDIMHGNLTLDQMWAARPVLGHGAYRGPVKGLYMCGAGTHPGGGVTGVPGRNAAREVVADRKRRPG